MSTGDIYEEDHTVDLDVRIDAAFAKPLTGISIYSENGVGEETIVFDQDDIPLGMIQAFELTVSTDGNPRLTLTYPNDRKRVVENCKLLRVPAFAPLGSGPPPHFPQ
jgi:hypothetical protein